MYWYYSSLTMSAESIEFHGEHKLSCETLIIRAQLFKTNDVVS